MSQLGAKASAAKSQRRAAEPGLDEPAKREGILCEEPPNQARMSQLAAEHEGPRGGSLGLNTKRRGQMWENPEGALRG